MAAVRPAHLPPNVLSTPGVQLLGKGAEARPLIAHLGPQLGDLGGLLVDLLAQGVLDALAVELVALEAMGDADRLGVGGGGRDDEAPGVDVARRGAGGS